MHRPEQGTGSSSLLLSTLFLRWGLSLLLELSPLWLGWLASLYRLMLGHLLFTWILFIASNWIQGAVSAGILPILDRYYSHSDSLQAQKRAPQDPLPTLWTLALPFFLPCLLWGWGQVLRQISPLELGTNSTTSYSPEPWLHWSPSCFYSYFLFLLWCFLGNLSNAHSQDSITMGLAMIFTPGFSCFLMILCWES